MCLLKYLMVVYQIVTVIVLRNFVANVSRPNEIKWCILLVVCCLCKTYFCYFIYFLLILKYYGILDPKMNPFLSILVHILWYVLECVYENQW